MTDQTHLKTETLKGPATKLPPNLEMRQSPFIEWPGHLVVPKYLSADDVLSWYENLPEDSDAARDDDRIGELKQFSQRKHLIKAWNIRGLKMQDLQGDGRGCPDFRLIVWANKVTRELLSEARNPLALRGKSSDTTDTEKQQQA